jgi:hypothetical protein
LEAKDYRLQASLSDLNGHDPHIHDGTQDGILRCLLDCFAFGTPTGALPFAVLQSLTRKLNRSVQALQREQGLRSPFHPYLFRQTIQAASRLARAEGLIG